MSGRKTTLDERDTRVKACNECRQQKLRCDANKESNRPCTRCDRMGHACIISPKFHRTPKQSKAELRREVSHLKSQLRNERGPAWGYTSASLPQNGPGNDVSLVQPSPDNSTSPDHAPEPWSNAASYSGVARGSPPPRHSTPRMGGCPPTAPSSLTASATSTHLLLSQVDDAPAGLRPHADHVPALQAISNDRHTTTQKVGDLEVEGQKIADCFSQFFEHYAPWLPGVFDPDISPDDQYQNSALLFWVMVCTGARGYKNDPTLFDSLSEIIADRAYSCMALLTQPVATIQAFLLLCAWPLPLKTLYKDPSPAWAGLAMQLAVQNGLHTFSVEEDFASRPRVRDPRVGPAAVSDALEDHGLAASRQSRKKKMEARAALWVNCLMVFQSVNMSDGLPNLTILGSNHLGTRQALQGLIDGRLHCHYLIHATQVEAASAISQAVNLENGQDDSQLLSLIQVFDAQLCRIVPDGGDAAGVFRRACARLSVLAFHFFINTEQGCARRFLQVHTVAKEVIEAASRASSHANPGRDLMQYHARMVTMAAYCILRIYKSPCKDELGLVDAPEVFFKAIEMARQRSIELGDLDSLTSVMLTHLWSSNKVFRHLDRRHGSLTISLRSRLAMSVVFDCFWWWRHEFGAILNDSVLSQTQSVSEDPGSKAPDRNGLPAVATPWTQQLDPLISGRLGFESEQLFDGNFGLDYGADWDWDWTATFGTLEGDKLPPLA